MHICIPDTREVKPPQGNAYLLYNIHIDGLYHCSLRYKQLLQLHQSLTKYFNNINSQSSATNSGKQQQVTLPQFPPKKLLPLSSTQTEERRQQLEKYLQNISQDKAISNSSIFNLFLLEAQRESTRIKPNQVHLDIELVNGQKIKLQIVTHDSADTILKAVCRALNLKDRYHAYFCLCLCGYDVVRDKLIIKRRLSFFESPYITLQMAIQQQEQLQNVLVSSSNCINNNHHQHPSHHLHHHHHFHNEGGSCTSTNINTSSSSSNSGVSSSNSSSGSSNGYSSMTSQSSANSSANCRCLSCSTGNFQLHHQQQQSNLTDVPSMCSSSDSYNANSTNNNNTNNNHLYNIDNSNSENFNNIDSSHYNNSNNHNISNSNSNNINNNNSTTNDNTIIRNNNHSHQCYYTSTDISNNWLTPSTSSSRSFVTHRILLRKSYWDPIYDIYILSDQQALNLLFIQTVYDMKHSLMFVDRETYHRLETLLATDQKLEYILLARTLKYYNHVHFEPCYSDYPRPRTKVMISIGSRELNMRVLKSPKSILSATSRGNQSTRSSTASSSSNNNNTDTSSGQQEQSATNTNNPNLESKQHLNKNQPILYCTSSLVPNSYHHLITKADLVEEEYSFKVPLIRCWRLTSLETLNNNGNTYGNHHSGVTSMFGHRSTSSAATTLAGGKRKSLSLFNGVIGNSNHSSDSNQQCREPNHRFSQQHNQPLNNQFGTNGRSLLAAMANLVETTSNGRSAFEDQSNNCSGDCCNNSSHNCNAVTAAAAAAAAATGPLTQMDHTQFIQYELSFEYLIAKDTLKWITISSDQAIFISISLQGVVDELVSKRDGFVDALYGSIERARGQNTSESQLLPPLGSSSSHPSNRLLQQHQQQQNHNNTFTYLYRDGSQKILNIGNHQPLERFVSPMTSNLPIHQSSSATQIATRPRQQQYQQQQQSRALSLFSSFTSSASGSSSAATVRGLISVWSSSDLAGSSTSGTNMSTGGGSGHQSSHYIPTCCGQPSTFEISSFRKEPSPIINDAFEGVMANDDDL